MDSDVALEFRKQILRKLVDGLHMMEQVVAVWEGGSAANAATDEYSDIDLNILVAGDEGPVFRNVEELLVPSHITDGSLHGEIGNLRSINAQ